jgi:hypothetical protein
MLIDGPLANGCNGWLEVTSHSPPWGPIMRSTLPVGKFAIIASVLCALSAQAQSGIIYVDDSAPARGANDGTSWENAFLDLHNGLKAAQAGDEVRIAQGVYKPALPNGSREATFNVPNGVIVQGGYAGFGADDPDALDHKNFITTLSGDLNGDDAPSFANYAENSYHVMTVDGVDPSTQIRGVTIRGGNANRFISNDDPHGQSGAVKCLNSAIPTMVDCAVRENRGNFAGGAIAAFGIHLLRCVFTQNHVLEFEPGGAVSLSTGPASIVECTFQSNSAKNVGGALFHTVGGASPLIIQRCLFLGNGSNEAAGAMSGGNFIAIDCDFIDNGAVHGAGAAYSYDGTFLNCRFLNNGSGCYSFANGAAVSISGSTNLINCLFSGNSGSYSTVGVHALTTEPVVISNCTFTGNNSSCQGAAIMASSNTSIRNCIVWQNSYDLNDSQSAQIITNPNTTLANNIIQGWNGTLGGTNNSGDDPQFINADGPDDDYGTEDDNPRLSAKSPAIDAGDNSFLPPDEFDLDDDGDTSEPIPLDLDGSPRILNDIIDLGAYEFPGAVNPCPGDISPVSGNGQVDVDDLLVVINNWGAVGSNPADITGNGIVDVDDLLAIINAWGACE